MIPDIRGKARLILEGDVILTGTFQISHDLNRGNGLVVAFEASGYEAAAFHARLGPGRRSDQERLALAGETDDGSPVRIQEVLIELRTLSREAGRPTKMTLNLFPRTSLIVGKPPKDASAFRFLCPNLLFGGMASTKQPDGGFRRDTILLETTYNRRQVRLRLRQLTGYDEMAEIVKQTTASAWTATLDVQAVDEAVLDEQEACSLVDDFLLLLSFALSRRALWVSLEVTDPPASYRRVRYGTATNLKAFPASVMGDGQLVAGDNRIPRQPLSEFMEVALPAYWALERDEQECLREAIDCMCESIERFFSPAAVTLAGRAFEALCKGFLDKEEQSYLSKKDCQQHVDLKVALRAKLEEFGALWTATEKSPAEEWRQRLDGHASYLLRRPFKLQLESLLEKYLVRTENPHDPSWGRQFVKARNNAAHPGPVGRQEFDSWLKGITLISQVLLKILGYSGPYRSFYGDGAAESKWPALN